MGYVFTNEEIEQGILTSKELYILNRMEWCLAKAERILKWHSGWADVVPDPKLVVELGIALFYKL